MTAQTIITYGAYLVTIFSIINLIMPPWERFAAWPRFQSYYRLMMIFVGYWANLNFKSKIWPELSVDNQAAAKISNGGGNTKP